MVNNTGHEDVLDIKKLLLKYLPNWYIFIICIAVALTGAYLFNKLSEPVYSVKSTLLINAEPRSGFLMEGAERSGRQDNWNNEVALLQSHGIVQRTLNSMKKDVQVSYYEIERVHGLSRRNEIYKASPFRVILDDETPQPFGQAFRITIIDQFSYKIEIPEEAEGFTGINTAFFGDTLEGPQHSFTLEVADSYNEALHKGKVYEFVLHNDRQLLSMYLGNLVVEPLGREFSIVEVVFNATNYERALDFVTTLTDEYIQQNLEEKYTTAKSSTEFIDEQLAEATRNLEETETRLQQYRETNQIMEVGAVAGQLFSELNALDRERSVEEMKSSYYDLIMDFVADDIEFSEVFGPSSLGITDPLLNSILAELNRLYNERSRLLLTTTPSSPSVRAIEGEINQSKATLQENIKSQKRANQLMLNDLNERIRRIEQRMSGLPRTERELLGFERMFRLQEDNYNYLMEKRSEAGIALASSLPDHRVINPAYPGGTISPKKTLNYALGLGIGMMVPLLFLIIRDLFKTRITQKDEVSRKLDYPIVGLIPEHKNNHKTKNPQLVVFDLNPSPIVEYFRSMRANMQFYAPKTKNTVIAVTSTRNKEGKTFASLNLAGSFAMLNRKTIYIDADMHKKSALELNGWVPKETGLSYYLAGKKELNEIIHQSEQNENLYFIASGGTKFFNPSELLESDATNKLLEELRDFEYIIIDTPPLGLVSDAMTLLAKVDVVMYLVRHNYSRQTDLEFLKDYNSKANLQNIVIGINNIKASGGYGYGYEYGYGLGYGKGYGKK